MKEKIYARLRWKKKDLRDQIEKLQSKGTHFSEEQVQLNDIKIPSKKRDRKMLQSMPCGFRLIDSDIKQDIQRIKQRAEQLEAGGK